jgi:hypothetical protein
MFASTEMLEVLGHLAWLGEYGGHGDAVSFVRAFVDAYRAHPAYRR